MIPAGYISIINSSEAINEVLAESSITFIEFKDLSFEGYNNAYLVSGIVFL